MDVSQLEARVKDVIEDYSEINYDIMKIVEFLEEFFNEISIHMSKKAILKSDVKTLIKNLK